METPIWHCRSIEGEHNGKPEPCSDTLTPPATFGRTIVQERDISQSDFLWAPRVGS